MKLIQTISVIISLVATASLVPAAEDDHAAHVQADPAAHQTPKPSSGDITLAHDLAAMRDKVTRLEAALKKQNSLPTNSKGMNIDGSGKSMKKMGDMAKKKMDEMEMKKMGGMGMKKMDGMGMKKMDGMEMMKMGMMKMNKMKMNKMKMAGMMGMSPMSGGMQDMASSSALPGFPGASHLYHLGSTGFFLDHGSHITLTTKQTKTLNQLKVQNALSSSAADRSIEQAEQELWQLTSADQPDIAAIEAKALEIAKTVAKKRVAFIRAVGEAAKLLTDDQRKSLTGFAPATPAMKKM